MMGVTPGRSGSFVCIPRGSFTSKARARNSRAFSHTSCCTPGGRTRMLADLLIGLTLWTATSVLAALSLGRILQRGKALPEPERRDESQADEHPLSDVA